MQFISTDGMSPPMWNPRSISSIHNEFSRMIDV